MLFFGEPWDAPVIDDAVPTATPVGEPCMHCEEPIVAGDRGFRLPSIVVGSVATGFVAIHRECMLQEVLGPVKLHEEELTRRESAIATWHRWVEVHDGVPE